MNALEIFKNFIQFDKEFVDALYVQFPQAITQLAGFIEKEKSELYCSSFNSALDELLEFIDGNGFIVTYEPTSCAGMSFYKIIPIYPEKIKEGPPIEESLNGISFEIEYETVSASTKERPLYLCHILISTLMKRHRYITNLKSLLKNKYNTITVFQPP